MRRLGELSRELDTAPGTRTELLPASGKRLVETKREVLAEAGISTSQAHRCERLAAVPEKKFEEYVAKNVTVKEILKSSNVHVGNNSGENEWYTPPEFIEAARNVMGSIDLDPASSAIANGTVKATQFFSIDDDGLKQIWKGRVWLNPPYSKDEVVLFADKLVGSLGKDGVTQAIVLVNNATETKWFQQLLEPSSAVCFPKSRIKFLDTKGNPSGAPLQGQAILYFGEQIEVFRNKFSKFGTIVRAF